MAEHMWDLKERAFAASLKGQVTALEMVWTARVLALTAQTSLTIFRRDGGKLTRACRANKSSTRDTHFRMRDKMAKSLYAAYFTGVAGSALGVFYIGDGIIVGADAGGLKYDGSLTERADGSLEGVVQFQVPPDTQLITGLAASEPQKITAPVTLAPGFDDGVTVTLINTPAGPVNARFERLRELP
jgi:hypothetical protein